MEITTIKQRLSLSEVLQHYGLQPRNHMLHCFMHEDKTASLQVNLEKNYYKCHGCGKTGDVIQFIEDYEKISKYEGIQKAKLLAESSEFSVERKTQNQHINVKEERGTAIGQTIISTETSALFLEKVYLSFRKGIFNCVPAKDYVKSRALQLEELEIGFNSGQLHYAERKGGEKGLIQNLLDVGLLSLAGTNSRTGGQAYKTFGIKSIVFPLKNKSGEIVSFYFRSIVNEKEARHFYLKNRSGIYPNYPNPETKKLILTEAIIDCASLLQIKEIRDNYSLISCFGTNGLNNEILNAIKDLKELEEIIFCFDQDKAGKEAIIKCSNLIMEQCTKPNEVVLRSQLKFTTVDLPNKDVNETLQYHDEEIFKELLEERKFIFSTEENGSGIAGHPYTTENGTGLKHQFLEIEGLAPAVFTKGVASGNRTQTNDLKNPTDFLQQKDLLKNLNQLIEQAGIIGEENSRLLLFLITISYLNKSPLHGIVQGSSGSGKTHIISRIADLMPQEDVLRFTRITESSLYNWGEFDLFQKIIIIEDLDGLKEDALYALREFISNQVLRSSVTIKDKKGNNKSSHKIVKGQFSSLSATTKGETYEDNMSRSFLLAVDESKEQTQRIIQYQNRRNAGEINPEEQQKAINFIQKLVRTLKHHDVVNPYATKLNLPEKVHKIRRLNEMYQAVIKQVTFLNQYQRRVASDNCLITEIEDIEQATEVLFESIILKVDELDGSLRQFFEKLKKYLIQKKGNKNHSDTEFMQREIRQEFNLSKTQLQRYINTLLELEYIKQVGGYNNTGIRYKVSYWDNYQKLRAEIKEYLLKQIKELKSSK